MAKGVMDNMVILQHIVGQVPCCMCGIYMPHNATNICVSCIQNRVDIIEGLQNHETILHFLGRNSYLQPTKTWIKA